MKMAGGLPVARVPDSIRPVERGTVVHMVSQASRQCDVLPWELLDYSVKPDCVVIILPAGQKVSFPGREEEEEPRRATREHESLVTDTSASSAAADTSLPESAIDHEIPMAEAIEVMHEIAGRKRRQARQKVGGKVNDV